MWLARGSSTARAFCYETFELKMALNLEKQLIFVGKMQEDNMTCNADDCPSMVPTISIRYCLDAYSKLNLNASLCQIYVDQYRHPHHLRAVTTLHRPLVCTRL